MKLKKTNLKVKALEKEEPKKAESKKDTKKDTKSLLSDKYKPLIENEKFLVSEVPQYKDPTKSVKFYLQSKVQRNSEDGIPYVYISTYQESELYTGYTKNNVKLPLEMLYTLIEDLQDLSEKADAENIVE